MSWGGGWNEWKKNDERWELRIKDNKIEISERRIFYEKGFQQFRNEFPWKIFSSTHRILFLLVSLFHHHPFPLILYGSLVLMAMARQHENPWQRLCWHSARREKVKKKGEIKFNGTNLSCLFAYDNQLWCIHQCY